MGRMTEPHLGRSDVVGARHVQRRSIKKGGKHTHSVSTISDTETTVFDYCKLGCTMQMDFRDAAAGEHIRLASPKQENKASCLAGHVRHNSTSSDSSGPRERTWSLYVLCFVTVPERASERVPSAHGPQGLPDAARRAECLARNPAPRRWRKCFQLCSRISQADETNPIHASIQLTRGKSPNQGQ